MRVRAWLIVHWPVLLFLATVVFATLYDPTHPDAGLPVAFAPTRFAAWISWPLALVLVPMGVGYAFVRRAWARGDFSPTDRMAMVWFLMCATWFHIGCDVLSGFLQVMPNVTDVYRAMTPGLELPRHARGRIGLDVVYWFELFVQMPLCWLVVFLYVRRSAARPAVECFLCGLHVTGTVAYYVPAVILGVTAHPLLTPGDRILASLWIVVPSALAVRAARSLVAQRRRGSEAIPRI
jgi:hypothetical protein